MADKARLSLNQITTEKWTVAQAVEGCVRHGIPSLALWRHKIDEAGLSSCVRAVKDAGLHISSVCRGGMFPAPSAEERRLRIADNFRAIDEAADLHADSLVMVVGPPNGCTLADARKMVEDGIAAIVPYARERNVRIGLEPLHPMFAADRSVLVTIRQALDLAAKFDASEVGIILDVFHFWWDPVLYESIAQCGSRIYGFHVSDWLSPLPDTLMGRGLMGDGVIEIRRIRDAVDAAGYSGPIEVEIFNQKLWDTPCDDVVKQVIERFLTHV
jgi:sugar phosphate isomerase/epimerase